MEAKEALSVDCKVSNKTTADILIEEAMDNLHGGNGGEEAARIRNNLHQTTALFMEVVPLGGILTVAARMGYTSSSSQSSSPQGSPPQ